MDSNYIFYLNLTKYPAYHLYIQANIQSYKLHVTIPLANKKETGIVYNFIYKPTNIVTPFRNHIAYPKRPETVGLAAQKRQKKEK